MSVCQFSCPSGFCLRLPGSPSCENAPQGGALRTTCNLAKSAADVPKWSLSEVPYCQKGKFAMH